VTLETFFKITSASQPASAFRAAERSDALPPIGRG